MKRFLKRAGVCAIAALLGASMFSFAGCADESANKTVISIHYYNGGLGSDWISEAKQKFEETFADVSFETGKKGVYVSITPDKNFNETATSMQTGAEKADILYTSEGNNLTQFVTMGVAYDATELAFAKVYDANGNLKLTEDGKGFVEQEYSLYDRMNSFHRDTYDLAGSQFDDGSHGEHWFPTLPYEDTIAGINLDYDLYSELVNKYSDRLEMTGYLYEGDSIAMPGTWDEFISLLTIIRDENSDKYSGFVGAIDYYTPAIQNAVIADVDGTDAGKTDPSTFSGFRMYDVNEGTYTFDGDSTPTQITDSNAYMLTQTRGYKAMTEIAFRLFATNQSGKGMYDPSMVSGTTYSQAQADFVMSKNSTTNPRILALLDGDWWENEARASFDTMGQINEADGYGKREYRMMPIPHMTAEEVAEGKTYKVGGFSGGYPLVLNKKTIEGNPVKEQVVKLWVLFQHSTDIMQTFTRWSGSVLPYNYDIPQEIMDELTPYARSIVELQLQDRLAEGDANKQIEIVRRNKLNWDSNVSNTQNAIDFRSDCTLGGQMRNLTNGHVLWNMITLAKKSSNFSWSEGDVPGLVEAYVEGMKIAHGGK